MRVGSIKELYWSAGEAKQKTKIRLIRYFSSWRQPDPDQIFWIDPKRVVYHTNYDNGCSNFADRVFRQQADKGKVIDGDWDQSPYKFSDLEVFKAISDRIMIGIDWEHTKFFNSTLKKIEQGHELWGCRDYHSFIQRCENIDHLINSIKNHQVLSPSQLPEMLHKCQNFTERDEIYVNIGRDGQYLFQDGRHRLAVAQILGVRQIPVKVLVRHTLWQALREQLLDMLEARGRGASKTGFIYQPALHADLLDIPAAHSCDERWIAIKHGLKSTSGKVLDIGANLCFFCHKFEMEGFDCTAVETSAEIANIADRIRIAEQRRFEVINGDILTPQFLDRCGKEAFDIVLALNIFHHFLKTKHIFDKFKLLLCNLQAKEIIFEPHLYTDKQMVGAYRNFQEDDFLTFLSSQTGLSKRELIHIAKDGRKIYRLF